MSKKRNYKVGDVVRFYHNTEIGRIISINLDSIPNKIRDLIEMGIYEYYDVYNTLNCTVEDLNNHRQFTIYMSDINGLVDMSFNNSIDDIIKTVKMKSCKEPVLMGTDETLKNISNRLKGENKMGVGTDIELIIRKIKDYKVFNNKAVVVYFMDGTTEKAVCDENDVFDLERAIEICVLKKYFGASNYASICKSSMKKIKAIDENKAVLAEEEIRIAKKKEKNAKKKAERIAKRKYAERQEQIAIQSAAFLQAMKDYDQLAVDMNHEEFMEEIERLNSAKELDVEIVVPGSDKN